MKSSYNRSISLEPTQQESVEKVTQLNSIEVNQQNQDDEIAERTYKDFHIAGPKSIVTQISRRAEPMDWSAAIRYSRELIEDGHSDWRLPTLDEMSLFVDLLDDDKFHWTRSIRDVNPGTWVAMRLSDGNWYSSHFYNDLYVRCVR